MNITTCPKNCKYSQFSYETKRLYCQCEANNEIIDIENKDRFTGESEYTASLQGMKYSSFQTMKCYKLVFSSKYFSKNIGSITVLGLIIAYIGFMIYYIMKDISPLKISLTTYLLEEQDFNDDNIKLNTLNPLLTLGEKSKMSKNKKLESRSVKQSSKKPRRKNIFSGSNNEFLYPPKKSRTNKIRVDSGEKRKETDVKLIDLITKKKKNKKQNNIRNKKNGQEKGNKKVDFDVESLKSDKVRKRKSIIDYEKEREIIMKQKEKEKEKEKQKEIEKIFIMPNTSDKELIQTMSIEEKDNETNTDNKSTFTKKQILKEKESKILEDYELNHLGYEDALEKDKRGFCKVYWSIIQRDELFLFTFVSWNDNNLFYIKIERFIFLIINIMAMNAFLFADMSIHKLYLNGVKYNFSQQMLQIILSVIISHVMEIFLCFLSLTDRYIYYIKGLPKKERTGVKIFEVLKKMKIRLVAFYVTIFFVSIFYWYFISAFCSVYFNTQSMYILDCVLSFAFFLIDPFFVYALVSLLRILSLCKNKNKKFKFLFKISRIFPIF